MAQQPSNKEIFWLVKDKYNGQNRPKDLAQDIRRLKNGEPIDYIIGWKPFLNCKIDLRHKPLIPRPETEFWTEKAIKEINTGSKQTVRVLDIFAGSGCVGIAVLKNCPDTKVDFADKSALCLKQIKLNLKLNKARANKIIKSDIFKNIKNKYDFIFANPPYIPEIRKKQLSRSVLDHEPHLALFGKKDGLAITKKFLTGAQKRIKTGGQIWFEFDYSQKTKLERLLGETTNQKYVFYKDQNDKWRYAVIFSGPISRKK